jgi:hypothetical protein
MANGVVYYDTINNYTIILKFLGSYRHLKLGTSQIFVREPSMSPSIANACSSNVCYGN